MTVQTAQRHAGSQHVGNQVREWRQRRRVSQLDCALDAEISQRHLSFIESGRTQPSRDMVLRIAQALDVPLRERNLMLLAAGYAPAYQHRSLDDPALAAARKSIDLILTAHEPFPALAVDRHWSLVAANAALGIFTQLVTDQALLTPPVNVLRVSLHPGGLAPHIENLDEWRSHILERLRREAATTGDRVIADLLAELKGFPATGADGSEVRSDFGGVLIPLTLHTPAGRLSFFSTTTVFGTPADVTLSEIAIEAFFPADAETAGRMRAVTGRP